MPSALFPISVSPAPMRCKATLRKPGRHIRIFFSLERRRRRSLSFERGQGGIREAAVTAGQTANLFLPVIAAGLSLEAAVSSPLTSNQAGHMFRGSEAVDMTSLRSRWFGFCSLPGGIPSLRSSRLLRLPLIPFLMEPRFLSAWRTSSTPARCVRGDASRLSWLKTILLAP